MLTRNIGVREVLWNPPLVYLELQCIYFINISRNPVDKKQPYSYNQQPQEGPLLLLCTFFMPGGKPHSSHTPNWPQMWPGDSCFVCCSCMKQHKNRISNITKQHPPQEFSYVDVSQREIRVKYV